MNTEPVFQYYLYFLYLQTQSLSSSVGVAMVSHEKTYPLLRFSFQVSNKLRAFSSLTVDVEGGGWKTSEGA